MQGKAVFPDWCIHASWDTARQVSWTHQLILLMLPLMSSALLLKMPYFYYIVSLDYKLVI